MIKLLLLEKEQGTLMNKKQRLPTLRSRWNRPRSPRLHWCKTAAARPSGSAHGAAGPPAGGRILLAVPNNLSPVLFPLGTSPFFDVVSMRGFPVLAFC